MRTRAFWIAVSALVGLLIEVPVAATTISCPNGTGSGDVCACVDGNPSCSNVAKRQGNSPAATLLLPFFEVDLGNPSGVTTLVSINNASAYAVLAHVVLWSDLSVPVLDYNLYLTGYDQQVLNLADLLVRGIIPQTASAGQDPNDTISPKGQFSQDLNFANCTDFLPIPNLPASFITHLQTSLTGQFSNLLGGCAGLAYGDNIARGYMTVDTVSNCTLRIPSDPGYFGTGGTGDVLNQNVLWGDYSYVDSSANRADAGTLVGIEADGTDPATSTPGQYTFYGRLVNWTAADNRKPLATNFGARFDLTGGNTYYVAWRDPKVQQDHFRCGNPPAWYPLAEEQLVIFDEQEHPHVPQTSAASPSPSGFVAPFPAATQKTKVGSAALPVPYSFGWTFLNLNTSVTPAGAVPPADPAAAQAWVEVLMDSQALYHVGFDAVKLDTAAKANHAVVGPLAGRAFYTLPPCRLVDTRWSNGPLGGPALQAVGTRAFQFAGTCGVPSDAVALVVNIAVTQPAAAGFLRIYPGDLGLPTVSVINFSAGQTRTNNAILVEPSSAAAGITVRNDTPGQVHLILDVNGYFR